MSSRKEELLILLKKSPKGLTAQEVADHLNIDRSNASRYLNELSKENQLTRSTGRPVVFSLTSTVSCNQRKKACLSSATEVKEVATPMTFQYLVGNQDSLKVSIQQAKAAILYPPRGLHTLIFGETGTGKSLFAECMYNFARASETISSAAPFVVFNCADYAQNPQLLFGHIFGIKKGAFTGADQDKAGLVAKADGGILFLDEIHRLPPEGQEMLFTFIDKGEYRPLGESSQVHQANVQIIGATTETSDIFLNTFTRRIPMVITLPPLKNRSLDEKFKIVSLFLKQEANRLNRRIIVERDAILAFLLYETIGNIGQVKRDLKLVCAKAFLHYKTSQLDYLSIQQKDLPLNVQKGLLKVKDSDELMSFSSNTSQFLTFEPGYDEPVWSKDPALDMRVYQVIDEQVAKACHESKQLDTLPELNLEKLVTQDVSNYFKTYVTELSKKDIHHDLVKEDYWELANYLLQVAEEKLHREYSDRLRFTFALHLQGSLERIKQGSPITHPDLNKVRRAYKEEFQVAIDLSTYIEDTYHLPIPLDEIGFITMFLALELSDQPDCSTGDMVEVVVMMHGEQVATSMLKTAQELLETSQGVAFDMPLTTDVKEMYDQLKNYVWTRRANLTQGLLLLTDMGSLNTFGNMLYEETGIRTKAISMTSTMIVLESLRMSGMRRSLEDIYQSVQGAFESLIRTELHPQLTKPLKAVIVACFTGEGVAKKLREQIQPIVEKEGIEIIQLQYLEKETFHRHIDELMVTYDLLAIVGTVDVHYQNIPFFSALDMFDSKQLAIFGRIVTEEVPLEQIIEGLKDNLPAVGSVSTLIQLLYQVVTHIQQDLKLMVDPAVTSGILIHLAFLVNQLKEEPVTRDFQNLLSFKKQYRLAFKIIHSQLLLVEKQYQVTFSEDEIAFLVQMFYQSSV
ncbi:sigma 54-interacting transcriptional regulator [Vagococcus humatus]|uniref:DNA translocase FtsK n=1 Tax=Vagococcus humatus TaxID=1889241 RepID=A0A3S0AYP1_9ENTE|nr:sigma-54-dependent transcriptional regulator [Vagococcus humatus]RST90131.1 ArsR family transcriptional regulator [Vagococcus humatus]